MIEVGTYNFLKTSYFEKFESLVATYLFVNILFASVKTPQWQEKSNKVFDSRQPPNDENTAIRKCQLEKKGVTCFVILYHFFANLKCFIKWLDFDILR